MTNSMFTYIPYSNRGYKVLHNGIEIGIVTRLSDKSWSHEHIPNASQAYGDHKYREDAAKACLEIYKQNN